MTDPAGNDTIEALARLLGPAHVLSSAEATAPYFTDWIGRMSGRALCVCRPGTTQEVAAVMRFCAERAIAVFPQGGNTGVTGGSVPLPGGRGVLLSLGRLNRIEAVDTDNDAMTAQAGCTLAAIQRAAEDHDRLFPLTLSSEGTCQIGGNVATNAGGTAVLRYGNIRDLVLGLEVVLADGRVWNGLRSLRKDNTGYDMKSLFIGAEGTLGIVTRVALKLFARPRQSSTAFVALPSPRAGVDLLNRCRSRGGGQLDAFELFSAGQLDIVLRHVPGTQRPLGGNGPWAALIEFRGNDDPAAADARLQDILERALKAGEIRDATIAASLAQRRDFWRIRHGVSEANRRQGLNFTHDTAVPISKVPEFLHRAQAAVARDFPGAATYCVAHLGDGNVHFTVTFPHAGPDRHGAPADLGARVARCVHDLAVGLGGSFGAEHGIGQRYRASLLRYKSDVELDLFRAMKAALDPLGLLNPGKVL